jgi:light-regulated signal transduction histidine kinase (bacteriophytochrome)
LQDLQQECEGRQIEWRIGALPVVNCDPGLIKQVFANLLSNAVKYTRRRELATIEVGQATADGVLVLFIRDNGAGFNQKYADKLFGVFQRLHRAEEFEGTGVGLATVQRIVRKHGGQIRAEGEVEKGATFSFSLGATTPAPATSKASAVFA